MAKAIWEVETHAEEVETMQEMVNDGSAWLMEGSVGRRAMDMIRNGEIMLGKTGHRDYYGNYVPSRYEVKAGTKGSPEFVKNRREY